MGAKMLGVGLYVCWTFPFIKSFTVKNTPTINPGELGGVNIHGRSHQGTFLFIG